MKIIKEFVSQIDKTLKYQFQTADGRILESCVLFFEERESAFIICISTQLGCECLCSFCATGHKNFIRNLTSQEIQEQVSLIINYRKEFQNQKFEITFMGTGEPLRNKENMLDSARCFSKTYQTLLTRINISSLFDSLNLTLAELQTIEKPVHFQYSLHFCDNALRNVYFRKNLAPLEHVLLFLDSIADYYKRPYCINYILFNQINDSTEDAQRLIRLTENHNAYLKISEYSPIPMGSLLPSQNQEQFVAKINSSNIPWKMFSSHGTDIHAACGHLLTDVAF